MLYKEATEVFPFTYLFRLLPNIRLILKLNPSVFYDERSYTKEGWHIKKYNSTLNRQHHDQALSKY